MQAHYEEVVCLFEELAGKDYDRFRTVADLGEDGRLAGAEGEENAHRSLLQIQCIHQ
jgi:hypothetical protein